MTKNETYANVVLSEQALKALEGDHWNTTSDDQKEISRALEAIRYERTLEKNRLTTVITRKNGKLTMS